jgi:hypothetical protein
MANVTLRLPDDLLEGAKHEASRRELSLNGWIVRVIDAALSPEHEPDERSRVREKLRRAGLLMETPSCGLPRPDPVVVERAGRELAKGTPVSDLVSEDRGPR